MDILYITCLTVIGIWAGFSFLKNIKEKPKVTEESLSPPFSSRLPAVPSLNWS